MSFEIYESLCSVGINEDGSARCLLDSKRPYFSQGQTVFVYFINIKISNYSGCCVTAAVIIADSHLTIGSVLTGQFSVEGEGSTLPVSLHNGEISTHRPNIDQLIYLSSPLNIFHAQGRGDNFQKDKGGGNLKISVDYYL